MTVEEKLKDDTEEAMAQKIAGKWIDGKLLDSRGNELSLPHKVCKGQDYMVEVNGS